ncbi:hypothetical protein WA577_001506, partial [Blastocystis sp. JDR]
MDCPIEKNNVGRYWDQCIQSNDVPFQYDDLYDRLRGYGFGETFIKNEGVIGDISRDINRTFPTHILFRHSGGMGQIMLENVLRCISEYYPSIGYCQGMNFVVGVILIGLVDPQGVGFGEDERKNELIIQHAMMESQSAIEKHTFAIFVNLTHLLHMEGLWSSGIPELKRFIFILQKYMQIHCPSLLTYFETIGYDVSIIVSKWFITLFAYTLPFPLLFRLWGYIFREKWTAIMRITIALLLFFEKDMLTKDIVELSAMMKDVRTEWLQSVQEQKQLFSLIIGLDDVTAKTYESFYQCYETESEHKNKLLQDYTPVVEKRAMREKREKVNTDITAIREKLEGISAQEYELKMTFHSLSCQLSEMENEASELEEYKRVEGRRGGEA